VVKFVAMKERVIDTESAEYVYRLASRPGASLASPPTR